MGLLKWLVFLIAPLDLFGMWLSEIHVYNTFVIIFLDHSYLHLCYGDPKGEVGNMFETLFSVTL